MSSKRTAMLIPGASPFGLLDITVWSRLGRHSEGEPPSRKARSLIRKGIWAKTGYSPEAAGFLNSVAKMTSASSPSAPAASMEVHQPP